MLIINMMKQYSIVLFLFLIQSSASACDACGCSAGGAYFGILPMYQRHFVGMRYQSRTFQSSHIYNDPDPSKEHFQTLDIWGRFYPSPRWQVFGFLPYNVFEKNELGKNLKTNGLGDISLIANYAVLNTGDSLFHRFRHTLMVGGGAKMPTGKHSFKDADGSALNPNMQTGTGSWDFIASANYTLRFQKQGIFTDFNARLNTKNTEGYRFGHRLSTTVKYFYWFELPEGVLMPSIGAYNEWTGKDSDRGKNVGDNSGSATFGSVGLDFYYKKVAVSGLFQTPIHQNIGDGLVKAQNRLSLNVSYLF
ncbi:MAG: hypothetical protein U5L45_19205 [Saprospiraceae bacterium]|nr:hypothetical protein [Saprospiraceae bacterium]